MEIRLNTEAAKELVESEAPDAVIIAAGSRPLLLKQIDGSANVRTGLKGMEVTPEGVICQDREGEQSWKSLIFMPVTIRNIGWKK